jgi:thioesterase domain-containing protein
MAVEFKNRMSAILGRDVSVQTIHEHPSTQQLAAELTRSGPDIYQPLFRFAERESVAQPVQPARSQLYCFHDVTGQSAIYRRLAEFPLGAGSVIGVRQRGLVAGETGFSTYVEMVETYSNAIRDEMQSSPILLLGYSLGGYIAHDVACQLKTHGIAVEGLIILDCVNQTDPTSFNTWTTEVVRLSDLNAAHPVIHGLSTGGVFDPETIGALPSVVSHNASLLSARRATGDFGGPALVVRASDTRDCVSDPALGWRSSCASVDSFDIPFKHFDLLKPHAAGLIAKIVREWLGEAPRSNATCRH